MKKQTIVEVVGATLAVLGAISLLIFVSFLGAPKASASGQAIGCDDSTRYLATTSPGYNRVCAANATTSPLSLGNGVTGATSTLSFYIPNATGFDLNMMAVASSTSSKVIWTVAFSYDAINWYFQGANSVSGGITTVTPQVYSWAIGTTSTTTLNTRISPVGARYVQIQESGSVASTSLYTQIIPTNSVN